MMQPMLADMVRLHQEDLFREIGRSRWPIGCPTRRTALHGCLLAKVGEILIDAGLWLRCRYGAALAPAPGGSQPRS